MLTTLTPQVRLLDCCSCRWKAHHLLRSLWQLIRRLVKRPSLSMRMPRQMTPTTVFMTGTCLWLLKGTSLCISKAFT